MRIGHSFHRGQGVRPYPFKRRLPDAPALEWLQDVSGCCPRITAIGSHSLLVENHTGLLMFTDSQIRLGSHAGAVCVLGSGLSLSDVRQGALIIHGNIHRVELPCDGGDGTL